MARLIPTCVLAMALAGCTSMAAQPPDTTARAPSASTGSATGASVAGTATYRERIALPPHAVFEAVIEDVAKAGAPAVVLARTEVKAPRVPVSFTIRYDPARLDPRARYSVRARILVDGRPWFTSDTIHPVLRGPGDAQVDILMRRVASAP